MLLIYIGTIIDNQDNFNFTFEESAYEDLLSKIINIDTDIKETLSNDRFKKFLHIHIDMIYDRIDLIDSATFPSLSKLKSMYKDYYPLTLELKSLIEKTYNINLSDLEILFILTLVIYVKQLEQLKVTN